MTQTARLHPDDILMHLIVTLLAPMFLIASDGDINMARMAAMETVCAYRARNHADLIAVVQIIAFGLGALGSLCLSMEDGISLSMILRLRGNAVSCNRAAEQNRKSLRDSLGHDPMPHDAATEAPRETPPEIAEPTNPPPEPAFLTPAAEEILAAEAEARLLGPQQQPPQHNPAPTTPGPTTPGPTTPAPTAPVPTARVPTARVPTASVVIDPKRHQQMWAIAMAKESADIAAGIPNLPPAEQEAARIRAATLSGTSHDLLAGTHPMPQAAQDPLIQPNAM